QHRARPRRRRSIRRSFRARARRHHRNADLEKIGRRIRRLSMELSGRVCGASRQQGIDRGRRHLAHSRRSRRIELRSGVDPRDAASHDPRHGTHRRAGEPRVRHDREICAHPGRAVSRGTPLIIYRKAQQLRMQRSAIPAPPFWAATTIAPYGPRRAAPVAIDYVELRASYSDRMEVTVCEDVRDELERSSRIVEPAMIEATEFAEVIFRRGEEALRFCCDTGATAIHLISTRGTAPMSTCDRAVVTIATWPIDFSRLEELFASAKERRLRWGVAIPVIFPAATNLGTLRDLADLARDNGAMFLAALPLDL